MQIEGKRRSIWPRVLGYFLAAMLLLTLVSRAADALLLPVVECARPLPGALSHIVTLRGVVEAEEQQSVAAEAGLTISRVCVRAGQTVEAGDVLAEYDREALQRILEEKQAALQTLTLQAQLETVSQDGKQPTGRHLQLRGEGLRIEGEPLPQGGRHGQEKGRRDVVLDEG